MTDLVALFEAKENARMVYEGIAMSNIIGKSPEERVEMDLAYKEAELAWFKACREYDDAIRNKLRETAQ